MITLRRGDTATLQFADLATAAGATLPTFAADDVVTFTLREAYESLDAIIAKVSTDPGSITVNTGQATGTVNIVPADWRVDIVEHELLDCVWDLQRTTSAGAVTTVASGTLALLPDVSRP